MKLVLVDACGANISSVVAALKRLGVKPVLSHDAETIQSADSVLLPGVGTARDAMERLAACQLDQLIPQLTQPVLGICVGMQVLFQSSAEDDCNCLGIFEGRLQHLPTDRQHPVPHMGWNLLQTDPAAEHPLLQSLGSQPWCYFVHSYAAPVSVNTLATSEYPHPFSAAVASKNFLGVQFHPERSGKTGEQVLQNFLTLSSA